MFPFRRGGAGRTPELTLWVWPIRAAEASIFCRNPSSKAVALIQRNGQHLSKEKLWATIPGEYVLRTPLQALWLKYWATGSGTKRVLCDSMQLPFSILNYQLPSLRLPWLHFLSHVKTQDSVRMIMSYTGYILDIFTQTLSAHLPLSSSLQRTNLAHTPF